MIKKDARTDYEDTLQGILMEITHVMSSLNMTPRPIEGSTEDAYLSESDHWAKHAYEHAEACQALVARLIEERDSGR